MIASAWQLSKVDYFVAGARQVSKDATWTIVLSRFTSECKTHQVDDVRARGNRKKEKFLTCPARHEKHILSDT